MKIIQFIYSKKEKYYRDRWKNSYPRNFLDDFVGSISISLNKNKKLFESKRKNSYLDEYLKINQYKFERIIKSSISSLFQYKKSYINIELSNNKISFGFIPTLYCKKIGKNLYQFNPYNNKWTKIPKTSFIYTKISDIQFHRKEINKLYKVLSYYDITKYDLTNIKDFVYYNKQKNFDLLKSSGKICWNARINDNKDITEFYYLIRLINFRIEQINTIQRIIDSINKKICCLEKTNNFNDSIVFKTDYSIKQYENLKNNLLQGKSSFEEAEKIIYPYI